MNQELQHAGESPSVDNRNDRNNVTREDGHHRSHEHHRSHSHHSDHKSSSHPKKHKRKSFLATIRTLWNKKLSRKKSLILSLSMLLILVVLVGSIHMYEMKRSDLPDNAQSGLIPDGTEQNETKTDMTNSDKQEESIRDVHLKDIPAYWQNMIEEKSSTVKALQAEGGKNCVSFVWASDTHIPDNSTAKTDDLGALMAKMMDNCAIPFAVITGDIGTRASFNTQEELEKTQSLIPDHLAPLWGTDRLLMAIGNHDGCYGDESCYYKKQFSPERMWELYFRNQALDSRRIFSEDGSYYYVDNAAQKTRFIILNSQYGGKYLVDENGISVNNRFQTSCYGQAQLDWLAEVALDMPEGFGAIITTHVPPNIVYTVDKDQLIGIINAYCRKTTYSGSYNEGVEGWTNNSVDVDFTDAKGEIIAVFAGHVHQDTLDFETLDCPLITIIAAGAQVNAGEIPKRTFGTDMETSFDVVTVNRETRTIYLTRVGWGEDRAIKY